MKKKFKRGMLVRFTDDNSIERLLQAQYFTTKAGLKRYKMFYYSTAKRHGWGLASDKEFDLLMAPLGFDKDERNQKNIINRI